MVRREGGRTEGGKEGEREGCNDEREGRRERGREGERKGKPESDTCTDTKIASIFPSAVNQLVQCM